MPETIQAYLEAVREQIRWKRARPVLIRELEQHLEDQRDAFVQEGKSPEEADRLAVEDMPLTVILDPQGGDLYEAGPRAYLEAEG